ncbi:hypothetical protein Ahy_B02g058103 [Arachis hypogaea]|uniref:Transposase MuDR plant domain-containing protein n=1 Tax=Arachis hypogaea TaxID=3818 RepID=A0A445ADV5_ARAHY|nr:hypothetical protein Ahy_B02g058103 [Arachis hypogaea]
MKSHFNILKYQEKCRVFCADRYPISVFGGSVQFQTKYVTDEVSMQEMFSMYIESRSQMSFIEFEEEYESNYEVVDPSGDEDQADSIMEVNVAKVTNALANQHLFEESFFIRALNLEAMHASKFPEYMNATELLVMVDGEFVMGMKFNFRKLVIVAMNDYTIHRGVDYWVYESELMTFYTKCTQYGSGCDWLIKISMICKKYCWSHLYQNYYFSRPFEVGFQHNCRSNKAIIAKVQSKFNYTTMWRISFKIVALASISWS